MPRRARCRVDAGSGTPPGCGSCGVGTVSGGVASLNHRLHPGNPPGCFGPRMEFRLQPGEASHCRTRMKFPRDGWLRTRRRLKAGLHPSLHRRTAAWVIPRLSPPRAHTPRRERRERCRERGRPRPHPPEPFSASRRACRAKWPMSWWRGFWHPSGVRGRVWGRCPVVSLRSTTGTILATLRVASAPVWIPGFSRGRRRLVERAGSSHATGACERHAA